MARESKFLEQIARARAASRPTSPATKSIEEMSSAELDQALVEARREAVAANRALAEAAAAVHTRPPTTLAATLRELQRGKTNHWR